MKVLIVEDNPKMRQMLSEFIKPLCEEIFECTDGSQALSNYKQHHPDWILMDWQMPETDGITATRQIINEFPKARICMVTTFVDEELKKEAFQVGAEGFVLKKNLFELKHILASEPDH